MYRLIVLFNCFLTIGAFGQKKSELIKGKLESAYNNETSGVAASGLNKGILYVHNDSGDSSRFFAITPEGVLKGIYYLKPDSGSAGALMLDCEDIAIGAGPEKNKSYVYLADIGDNAARRKFVTVYRIAEPLLSSNTAFLRAAVPAAAAHLKYPDGARDAEAMMIDPLENLLYIVSKREDSVGVYTAPLLFAAGDTLLLKKETALFFPGGRIGKWITTGDISRDGRQILLKSYSKIYYWKRKDKEPVWKAMLRKPVELPYKQEWQGEAVAFSVDGKGYYTVGEGFHQPLFYYQLSGHE